jgi:hypothetical protein
MSRLTYLTGWALVAVTGAFLLTNWLLPPRPPLDLTARCKQMRAMQIRVYNGTRAVAQAVEANADKKPSPENIQDALALADAQQQVINEANQAIQMLEAEGSAVAFHEVFAQLRDDMKTVQRRLEVADVGKVNQLLQQDIIDILREMIWALKKPVSDIATEKSPPETAP